MHIEFDLEILDPNTGSEAIILDPDREYPFVKKGEIVEGVLLTGKQLKSLEIMRRSILRSKYYLENGLTPD